MILVIEFRSSVSDDAIRLAGLTALDTSTRSASVVFADDTELTTFRSRLEEYRRGPQVRPDGTEGAARHESFFDSIESIRPRTIADRITTRLEEEVGQTEAAVPFDVECWFVENLARTEEWLRTIRQRVEEAGGEWLDEFVSGSAGVALARCRGTAETVRAVAELDEVAVLDSVPQPRLERSELAELQAIEEVEVIDLDGDNPVVGVIDSGVRGGHPLIAPALVDAVALHPQFGGQAEDEHGHGTSVTGIALYGDVLASARAGEFHPHFYIASVRVLDADARVPENASFVRVIDQAIRYLVETWDCRVVNISIGDPLSPYLGGKSSPAAASLDALARALDVVIVVSSGNISPDELVPHRDVLPTYPRYLIDGTRGILDPSQSALALTVGGSTVHDGSSSPTLFGTNLGANAVAGANGPSPFTRSGPGTLQSIKPELSEEAGNWVFDRTTGVLRQDIATSVVSTSGDWPRRFFDTHVGTSFSAPKVAHLAGRIATEYPGITSNTIRALLLQGADNSAIRAALSSDLEGGELDSAVLSLAGFGLPTWERCGESQDSRVVMYAEDAIRPDSFHVYRIPITEAFSGTPARHELTVGLAYDPPVRHHRFDYLSHKMEFTVVRGVSLERVFELASADADDGDDQLSRSEYVALWPRRTIRSRGTNQAAVAISSQRPRERFRDDWYVVVKSIDRWLGQDAGPQRYSLAIGIAAENGADLYAEVEQRVELELTAEVRAQG